MSVIFNDTIAYNGSVYTLYYNPTANQINLEPDDGTLQFIVLTTDQRGRSNGDVISNAISSTGIHVTILASLSYPFATLRQTSGGTTTPPDDDSGCDLVINNITTANTSQPGIADGTIVFNAFSTHLPILYSINNSSWQNSPAFTGLAAGTGTGYAKDANGCTAQMAYYVGSYPAVVNRLVSTPATGQSRWSALFNPIVFGYQSAVAQPGRKFITQITSGYNGAANVITATHSANLTGYCRADISKYLRTLLQPADELDYTAINYRDANISASYTVQYKEVVNGVEDANWTSAGNPFYVTYSAMQIGNKTGGNMQPYVTLPDAGQTAPARFLNDFTNPVFYTDMPWDLSFIYSEKVSGLQLRLGGNGIDINGDICGSLGELMLLNEDGSVLLNNDGSKFLIEKQAPGVLYNQLGVNRLRITQYIPANSNWLDVFVYYTDAAGNNIPVTESRRLLLDNSPCNGLPYEYLKWMGPSGSWMYYMLVKNQLHEMNTSATIITERYIDDYAAADSTQQLISISAQRKITAGKNDIPAAEAEALATILYSPKVYRLVDAATNTWQGVIIDTKSLKMYQTYGQLGDFEISYLLPEGNVQVG